MFAVPLFQMPITTGTIASIGICISRFSKGFKSIYSKENQSRKLSLLHQMSNAGVDELSVGENLVFQMTGIRDGCLSADAGILAGYTSLQDHRR